MHGKITIHGDKVRKNNHSHGYLKNGMYYYDLRPNIDFSCLDKYKEDLIEVDIYAKHKNISKKSGVYIYFIESKDIRDALYIGSSKSLYSRLTSHWGHQHIAKKIHTDLKITLKYFLCDGYKWKESSLIRSLNPFMNTNDNWSYEKFQA